MRLATALVLPLVLAPAVRAQAPAPATLFAEVGGLVPGGTAEIVSVGLPFAFGNGEVAFSGTLVAAGDTVGFVFAGDGVRWRNDEAGPPLTGREVWMGAGDAGQFVYSPLVDGDDGLWTDLGLLVRRGDPAPDLSDRFISFASRPGLLQGGAVHWISGLAGTAGGPTEARAFYVSPDRTAASAAPVFLEGLPVDGVNVTALDFSYGVSDDGAHRTFVVTRATGSTATDGAVVLDGEVLAQEGQPAGGGTERWQSFDLVRVNSAGHHVMSGDTDGAASADEFVAYDGQIEIREGETLAGVTLGAEVRGLALDEESRAVWAWTTSAGPDDEALFAGLMGQLPHTAQLLLRTGQGLDTSGDGVADYTVADFAFANGHGHGALALGMSDAGGSRVYVRLDLTPAAGGPNRHALVGLDFSILTPSNEPGAAGPARGALDVAPNPFRDGATLALTLDRAQAVTVDVLDVLGRRVALLHDGPLAAGAAHRFRLEGAALPAGLYLVRATGEGWAAARRVVRADRTATEGR
jgi:hypothetical protein